MSKIWVNFFWLRQILKNVSVCFSSRISILVRLIEMEKEIYGRATLAQQGMLSHLTSVQERIYFWSVLQPTFLQLFPSYVCIYVWTLLLWTFRDLREGDSAWSMLHVCMFTVSFHNLRFFLQFQKFYSSYEIEMVTLFFLWDFLTFYI